MRAQPDWSSPAWLSTASQWIQEQTALYGLTPIRPPEQLLVSLWSTVLRSTTTTATLYFKASAPFFAYEPALTLKLAQLAPSYTPAVLSIDPARHWILMRDAGTPLSELMARRADARHWEEVLRSYAQMQMHLLGQQETLLAVGCPDRRLDQLPRLLDEALSWRSFLLLGQEDGLPEDEYTQLQTLAPVVRALCGELKSHGIPETLHHDDLHAGNILFNGQHTIFFDWAESAITHPFCALVIVERFCQHVLKFSPETITHLRDCYLQQWTQFEPLEQLQSAYNIAQRLGKLCRALTWGGLLINLSPDEARAYRGAFPYWLRLFLGTVA